MHSKAVDLNVVRYYVVSHKYIRWWIVY